LVDTPTDATKAGDSRLKRSGVPVFDGKAWVEKRNQRTAATNATSSFCPAAGACQLPFPAS
jgi:hypothetical protein